MDLKESDSKILKESGVKKFLKGVVSAVALMAMSAGLVEQTEGRFSRGVCTLLGAGSPVTYTQIDYVDRMACDISLANIYGNAIAIPLSCIATDFGNVGGAAAAVTAFTGGGPLAGALAAPAVHAVPAAGVAITAGFVANIRAAIAGAGAPAAIVGMPAYNQAADAMSKLILAAYWAVRSALENAADANILALAGATPSGAPLPGLNFAACRAYQAVVMTGGPMAVGNNKEPLIYNFLTAPAANVLVPPPDPAVVAAQNQGVVAYNLWTHMMNVGHLWRNTGAPAVNDEYIAWMRAGRIGTPALPPVHSSIVVPPAAAPAATFANVLLASGAVLPAAMEVTWGGVSYTVAGIPAAGAAFAPIGGTNVGVHIHGIVGFNMIKCNLFGLPGLIANLTPTGVPIAARPPVPTLGGAALIGVNSTVAQLETIAMLRERAATIHQLGLAGGAAVAGLFPPPALGGAQATAAAPVPMTTLSLVTNGGLVNAMYPE